MECCKLLLLIVFVNKSTQRAHTPPRPLHCRPVMTEYILSKMPYLIRPLQLCRLVSDNMSQKCASGSVKEREKLIAVPDPDLDQHQNVITPRGSLLAHAYHVWSTSINAVWLSGNALASINVVALRQTRLVRGWVTICGRVNHFSM